jgi:hypothetical protein
VTVKVRVPRRIQRKRAAGWKLPEGAICVTRPGKWGNPFAAGEAISRDSPLWPYAISVIPGGARGMFGAALSSVTLLRAEDVVRAHFYWFVDQPALMLSVAAELGGHDLACWCKPGAPCHGDFLLGMANDLPGDENWGL